MNDVLAAVTEEFIAESKAANDKYSREYADLKAEFDAKVAPVKAAFNAESHARLLAFQKKRTAIEAESESGR